ncbi:MAG TPA: DUF4189 domain-containing protein [Candidatus Binataceae bacterium]
MKLRWIGSAALAVVLSLAALGALARADCVDDCERAYGGYGTDASLEAEQECYRLQCANLPKYGAIAYAEKNGAYGFSYDVNNADEANHRALSNCAKNGDGCKVVISFSNNCAALAAGDNNRFATSMAGTRAQAQADAMTACGSSGGHNCDIKAWTCARE